MKQDELLVSMYLGFGFLSLVYLRHGIGSLRVADVYFDVLIGKVAGLLSGEVTCEI